VARGLRLRARRAGFALHSRGQLVYPAVLRLYSLGYVDNVFLGLRPWTRQCGHMVEEAGARIEDANGDAKAGAANDEAREIYTALMRELSADSQGPCLAHRQAAASNRFTLWRAHQRNALARQLPSGSTLINDYGRPTRTLQQLLRRQRLRHRRPFTFYARGEFEAAPSPRLLPGTGPDAQWD